MSDEGFTMGEATAGLGNLGPTPAPPGKRKYTRRTSGEPRAERQPRRPRTKVDTKAIYNVIGMGVAGGNKLGNLNPWWKTSGFLRPDEVEALSIALGDEAMSHKQLIKWLESTADNVVHIKLAMVLLAIAVPRLAMLGMLPPELIEVFSIMVTTGKQAEQSAKEPTQSEGDDSAAVRDRTGRTYQSNGTNGEREVNDSRSDFEQGSIESPSWESVEPPVVQAFPAKQTG